MCLLFVFTVALFLHAVFTFYLGLCVRACYPFKRDRSGYCRSRENGVIELGV